MNDQPENLPEGSNDPKFIAADEQAPKGPINWNALAESRIQAAQQEGKFQSLPGFGKPIPGIDNVHDEQWWIREKLRREQLELLPPALAIAREVERFWLALDRLATEQAVRDAVDEMNQKIRAAHYSSAPGPPNRTMPLVIEDVLSRWQRTRPRPQA